MSFSIENGLCVVIIQIEIKKKGMLAENFRILVRLYTIIPRDVLMRLREGNEDNSSSDCYIVVCLIYLSLFWELVIKCARAYMQCT